MFVLLLPLCLPCKDVTPLFLGLLEQRAEEFENAQVIKYRCVCTQYWVKSLNVGLLLNHDKANVWRHKSQNLHCAGFILLQVDRTFSSALEKVC